ncbi:MAG: hypothetical protein N2606_00325 [Candidatus Omnitrophica bacterium]|nr:hypothetical protein [Candidatus Omnitrophota bacterium]
MAGKKSLILLTDHYIHFFEAQENLEPRQIKEFFQDNRKKEQLISLLRAFVKEKKIVPEYLILILPRSHAIVRFLRLPSTNDVEISQMVGYEVSSQIPIRQEDLVYDYIVMEKNSDGYSELALFVLPRQMLITQLNFLKHCGLLVDEVTITTVSLYQQVVKKISEDGAYLYIYFEKDFVELIVLEGKKMVFSRAISYNGDNKQLLSDIKQSIFSLTAYGRVLKRVFLCGFLDKYNEIIEKIKHLFSVSVETDLDIELKKGFTSSYFTQRVNLLPKEQKVHKLLIQRRRHLVYFGILVFLNITLLADIFLFKIKVQNQYLESLKKEIENIEQPVMVLQKKMLRVSLLEEAMNHGRFSLGLLSEVFNKAPSGIVLTSLDISAGYSGGSLILIGQANDSETVHRFTNSLKSLIFLKDASLMYANIRKTPTAEVVDFEIRASF